MKKYFLISALTLFVLTGCKKDPSTDMNSDNMNDSTAVVNESMSDTTMTDTTMTDTTMSAEDRAKLLNKMTVEKTTTSTDPSDGKFTLSENKWILSELNGKAISNKTAKDYFINLDSKSGKFAGFAGCNNLNGQYTMTKPGKLSFTNMLSTKMACNDMKTEGDFMKAMEMVDNYSVEGDMLHLYKGKKLLIMFSIKK